jgi:hypothetical protein
MHSTAANMKKTHAANARIPASTVALEFLTVTCMIGVLAAKAGQREKRIQNTTRLIATPL